MSPTLPRALAAALLATLLLAGCGDDDESGAGDDRATPSGQATDQEESPDRSATGGFPDLDAGSFYETVIRAQEEAGSYRGVVTTSTGGQTSARDLEAEYDDSGTAVVRTTSRPDAAMAMTTITTDGVLYLQGDAFGTPDGTWLKYDTSAPENADTLIGQIMSSADPTKVFEAMSDPKGFEVLGRKTIDGVVAKHYRLTIDSARYVEKLGLPAQVAEGLPAEVNLDMWVDAQSRPVLIRQAYDVAGQRVELEQAFTDYGADIDIDVPDDADLVTR